MIGVTHLPVVAVVPFTCGLIGLAAWYWTRLGKAGVPAGRRRLRRMSLGAAVMGLPATAAGFAIVDPDVRPVVYSLTWCIALVAILVAVGLAMIDAVSCLSELRRERLRLREEPRRELEATLAARSSRGGAE